MCTNNTCDPDVDCPNKNDCPSGSDCTTGCGGNCSSDSSCNGSCGDCCDGTCNSTVPVSAVTVCPGAVTLKVGRWYHDLSAAVSPSGANQHVCWSSSNESVASVHPETGYVYGIGEGTAVITATSCADSSKSDSCTVTVGPVLVESITLCDSMVEIGKETTYNMCATVCPEDADNKALYWFSYDESIATVSQNGVITGRSAGQTTICAAAQDGGSAVIAECAVWVIVPVASVELVLSSLDLHCGHDLPLIATVLPGDASDKRLRWHSEDPSVASVDPETGVITGQAVGTTTIHATSLTNPENTDSCIVTVVPYAAPFVERTMDVGETLDLKDMLHHSEAFNRALTWSSSDETVAAVDTNGGVVACKEGTAVILVATEDSEYVCQCSIVVNSLLIYQSRNTELYKPVSDESTEEELREDLLFNDLSKAEIQSVTFITEDNFTELVSINIDDGSGFYREFSKEERKNIFLAMCQERFANDTFDPIVQDMIEHFMQEKNENFDGTIEDYSVYRNSALTALIKDHPKSEEYVKNTKEVFDQSLKDCGNNLYQLKYDPLLRFDLDAREEHPFVKVAGEKRVEQPAFKESFIDLISSNGEGFHICIHGLHGTKVEIVSYNSDDHSYSGIMRFTYYDHFGLDAEDVTKFPVSRLDGFKQWYILQHWNALSAVPHPKPFVTMMEFEVPFSSEF